MPRVGCVRLLLNPLTMRPLTAPKGIIPQLQTSHQRDVVISLTEQATTIVPPTFWESSPGEKVVECGSPVKPPHGFILATELPNMQITIVAAQALCSAHGLRFTLLSRQVGQLRFFEFTDLDLDIDADLIATRARISGIVDHINNNHMRHAYYAMMHDEWSGLAEGGFNVVLGSPFHHSITRVRIDLLDLTVMPMGQCELRVFPRARADRTITMAMLADHLGLCNAHNLLL